MIRVLSLVSLLLGTCTCALAQEPWKAVFVTEPGSRVDYMTNGNKFVASGDQASRYRFEFTVPPEGNSATIRLLPVGENTAPSEDYDALIVSRGEDMIVLVMVTAGLTRGDKFETYTLYPRLGTGFLTETSSFLGNPSMKSVAPDDPRIPAASAKAFPLRRIDK